MIIGNAISPVNRFIGGGGGGSVTPPLDLFSSSIGAWSVSRKLRTAYIGDCIKVRRDSDNSVLDIGFDGNGNLDESALLTFVGVGSGFVHTISDQSVLGNDAIQTIAANQPRIVLSGVVEKDNEKPAMFFDGVSDLLEIPSSQPTFNFMHNGDDATIFTVASGASATQGAIYGNNGGSNTSVGVFNYFDDTSPEEDAIRYIVFTGGSASSETIRTNDRAIISQFSDANNTTILDRYELYINGGSAIKTNASTTAPSTANANHNFQVGAGGSDANPFTGSIQELVIFNANYLTEQPLIRDNINTHYNTY